MVFQRAVELLDAGDAEGLRAHLQAHPGLVTQRVKLEPGYFENPTLLAFCAENPIRHGRLPAGIVEVTRVILEAGPEPGTLHFTLALVCSGRVARECGVQGALIDLLCDFGADPNHSLQAAVAHGEFAAVDALLRRGATLDLPTAAALGLVDEARAMLSGASPESRHKALAFAAQHGRVETLRLLLDAGEDPNRFNPPNCHAHSTPLHQAVCYGHVETVRLLVERGARVDVEDRLHGGTALDWAEHCGQKEVEAYLRRRVVR
jgi:hypothetical protein